MIRPRTLKTLFTLSLLPLAACVTKPGELGGLDDDAGQDGDAGDDVGATTGGAGDAGESDGAEDDGQDTGVNDDGGTMVACDVGPGLPRYLDPVKWTNAVQDLIGVDAPPLGVDAQTAFGTPFAYTPPTASSEEAFVEGAAAAAALLPDDHVPCEGDEEACLTDFAAGIASRAWRRIVPAVEAAELVPADGAYDDRARAIAETVMASPDFYDITETGVADPEDGGRIILDRRSTATRIALLVWNSLPDYELLQRAADGELDDPEVRREELIRMLQGPRAAAAVGDYTEQWLGLSELRDADKLLDGWDAAIAEAAITEARMFAVDVTLDQDGTWDDLLSRSSSFANGPLAALVYGDDIDGAPPVGDDFSAVVFDSVRRGGLFTLAAPLASWAHAESIGISQRGIAIRQRVLCQQLPAPPPDIDPMPPVESDATSRHEFQADVIPAPDCTGCHVLFDPITFGFDHYDAFGRWQTSLAVDGHLDDGTGVPVDPSGSVEAIDIDGEYSDREELMEILRTAPEARECAVVQRLQFAYGRELSDQDECTVNELTALFDAQGGSLSAVLGDIVAHDTFILARP